jgi:hypothetical protein
MASVSGDVAGNDRDDLGVDARGSHTAEGALITAKAKSGAEQSGEVLATTAISATSGLNLTKMRAGTAPMRHIHCAEK